MKEHVYIYSFNFIGRELCARMISKGYQIKGFFDLKFLDSKEVEDAKKEFGDLLFCPLNSFVPDENIHLSICIICLQNGLLHEKIAVELSKKGFKKIVFLPFSNLLSIKSQSEMRVNYNRVLNGNFDCLKTIPDVKFYNLPLRVISEDSETISLWCPVKILRTGDKEFFDNIFSKNGKQTRSLFNRYIDVEFDEYEPYFELFNYILKKSYKEPSNYLDLMAGQDKQQRDRLLEDRKKLVSIFEENYLINQLFFLDSPAKVCFQNRSKAPYISDGWHRAVYLRIKGQNVVPIVIDKKRLNDLLIWMEK